MFRASSPLIASLVVAAMLFLRDPSIPPGVLLLLALMVLALVLVPLEMLAVALGRIERKWIGLLLAALLPTIFYGSIFGIWEFVLPSDSDAPDFSPAELLQDSLAIGAQFAMFCVIFTWIHQTSRQRVPLAVEGP
jgi:hypothetical protein